MAKIKRFKFPVALTILGLLLLGGLAFVVQDKFKAPRKDTPNIQYTIRKDKTLEAIIGDLKYYDFIKDENAFKFALEHTQDNSKEGENYIKVGQGSKTIEREAIYTISQSMNTWELASVLLNDGTRQDCNHGCPESNFNPELLPGGDLAPTISQRYEWVKTYEDCVKAVGTGHDGGQLSSEQYFQKTGIRKCVSPDSREFTEGKEGWTPAVGG